jgi:ketosteroid isomerase-like protein
VTDPAVERIRSFLLTELDLPPRDDWVAAIDPAMPDAQREFQLEVGDAYLNGDVEWLLDHTHPEAEIVQPPELPGARTYHGREGMIQALLDWPLQWENFGLTPRRVFAVDDEWVLTVAMHRGHARQIGIDVEAEITWAVRWQDQLMLRWEMYMTVEAALEALAAEDARQADP